jgi:small nuclear ribonucleoprotein (snRNP)-like protein
MGKLTLLIYKVRSSASLEYHMSTRVDSKWITKLKHRTLLFWLDSLVGGRVHVVLSDERILQGILIEVDMSMNVVLYELDDIHDAYDIDVDTNDSRVTMISAKKIRFISPVITKSMQETKE